MGNARQRCCGVVVVAATMCFAAPHGLAEEWTRFRGPNGTGVVTGPTPPVEWSDSKNIRLKVTLPGAGSSCPVLNADSVFVTCYTETNGGVERQLVCVRRSDGRIAWTKAAPVVGEDPYGGYITEHGYASNSCVTDGERVYAFFSKAGLLACDVAGKELWKADVGRQSGSKQWGSGSSLVLLDDMLIVNAADESRSIRAFDKRTGKELWKSEAGTLDSCYSTPSIAKQGDRTYLIVSVVGEVWGLNPSNGKLAWYAETGLTGNMSPSPLVDGERVFVFGGFRSAGSMCLKVGGKGDVTASNRIWSSKNSSYVATPVLHNEHLYWIDDRGLAWCIDARTGNQVYKQRVPNLSGQGRPVYASPVVADGKIFVVSRWDGTFVLPAEPAFSILRRNVLDDDSGFNATPAVLDGELWLRSNRALYCVGAGQET